MDTMEIYDDMYLNKSHTMEGLISTDFQRRKPPCRCVTLCLGLLCALLLAGNIGQIIYYEIINRLAPADPTQASYGTQVEQLQSRYEALTTDRNQLEARLSHLTEEKDQLQQSLNISTIERDEFKVAFDDLTNQKDQLEASYNTSKQEGHQLQTSYNDVQRNLTELQTNYNDLISRKDQLQSNYSDLQREQSKSQTVIHLLQGKYLSLQGDKDQLQRSYNKLDINKTLLQNSYNSLWKDKQQLQTRYNALQSEKRQLQTNYDSLSTERDKLQKKIDQIRRKPCPPGWHKFDISCYFVSKAFKNWTSSRDYCITRGADLVVINSRDEQIFANGLLTSGQNVWIGLTDSLEEGTWTWVDGTPFTTSYWQPGQPNSYNGNQDCGEIVSDSAGVGKWNDDGCFSEQLWMCEN